MHCYAPVHLLFESVNDRSVSARALYETRLPRMRERFDATALNPSASPARSFVPGDILNSSFGGIICVQGVVRVLLITY